MQIHYVHFPGKREFQPAVGAFAISFGREPPGCNDLGILSKRNPQPWLAARFCQAFGTKYQKRCCISDVLGVRQKRGCFIALPRL